ncbi:hypothetical protein SUDANB25_04567 [Streptomyces sp. SudanB25_2051]
MNRKNAPAAAVAAALAPGSAAVAAPRSLPVDDIAVS